MPSIHFFKLSWVLQHPSRDNPFQVCELTGSLLVEN